MEAEYRPHIEIIGWCVVATDKTSNMSRPMGYGKPYQPGPSQLLFEGGVTVFEEEKIAWDALKESLSACEKEGQEWMEKYWFNLAPATRKIDT